MQRRMRIGEGQTQTGVATARAMGYGFDANGHPVSLVYPGGLTLTFTVDALGQASAIASPGQTWASGIAHDPDGVITGFTYGNGIVHSLTRNARKLPLRSRDLDGATAVHDDSYTYDAVGNVTAIDDGVTGHRGDRTMTYDDLNRLTGATSPMFDTASYGYDVQDNLVRVTVTGGAARDRDYCYDAANRLTNIKTGGCAGTTVVGLGYDLQGNLDNRNGTLYAFDYGNRLRGVGTERYRYDAWGRRTQTASAIDSDTIDSLYGQDGALYFQVDERAGKVLWYVYLGGSLIATRSEPLVGGTAQIAWQHTDALGTPVAITNGSRTVIERREYEPYGYQLTPMLQDGPNYTGHVADAATGMVYMQQRYYDPFLGRFESVDPVGALSGPFNRYWYGNSNPYRFSDPDGRASWEDVKNFFKGVIIQVADSALEDAHYSTINPTVVEAYPGELSIAGQCNCEYQSPFSKAATNEEQLGRDVAPAVAIVATLLLRKPEPGLTAPRTFFGNKTKSEVKAVLEAKYGPPKSSRLGADTYYDARGKRSYNVHEEAGHNDGKPHVDIRRRGGYPERKYDLQED